MFVTNSLSGGGAERAMNLASNELHLRGWTTALVPINKSGPDFIEPTSEVFPLMREWRDGLIGTAIAYFKFNRLVASWKPDLIVLTCDLPEFFGAGLILRKQLVIVEEASNPWGTRVLFGKFIRKILMLRGVKTIAASSHLRIWPKKILPDFVIQNMLTPYESHRSEEHKLGSLENLIFIGRLSREKQPNWFIEICDLGGFNGRIIGDGQMRDSLIDFSANKSVEIKFLGFLSDPWQGLMGDDLLIVPSMSEGDGLVVIEAIKHGIPLLLSDIPDFRRFALPERNYCLDVHAFVNRASEYRNKLQELVVPVEVANTILSSRSAISIGNKWEEFLSSLQD
jgi:glycosyltransferase involved in cell wall biosynthesis